MASEAATEVESRLRAPRWTATLLLLVLGAGVLAFAAVAMGGDPGRAWRALLVNFLFWAGIAQAGVVWAAVFRTTAARWAPAVARLGQATVAFLPLSLIVLVVLYAGRRHFLLWLGEPLGDRAAWLNAPFLFSRDLAGLALLCALSVLYVGLNVRTDQAVLRGEAEPSPVPAQQRLTQVSVAILITYAVVYTLIAFDLIMSLDGHWYSTLLGAHFLVSNLYVGMAALILAAVAVRRPLGVTGHIGRSQLADLGNLLMAFGMLTVSFFFCQLLTIWYGNLPEETSYFAVRLHAPAWWPYGYVVLVVGYLAPFFLLLTREVKHNHRLLATVAVAVVGGMWLERYLLVVPTLRPEGAPPGAVEALVGLGLAAALVWCVLLFLGRYPPVSYADLARGREQAS